MNKTKLRLLNGVKDTILDALFPALCGGCGRAGRYVCENCELFLGEAAFICPVCRGGSFEGARHGYCAGSRYGLDGLVSMWEYEGVAQHLLGQMKYKRISHIAKGLVDLALKTMAQDRQRFSKFLSFLFASDTILTFVPIYRRKEKDRGFNQSRLVAKEIGRATDKPVFPLLEKVRDTKAQAHLDKEERLQNLKEAFRFESDHIPEKLVLVDDVWTTGATMKECAKELKKAGVKEVWGFTLARTP